MLSSGIMIPKHTFTRVAQFRKSQTFIQKVGNDTIQKHKRKNIKQTQDILGAIYDECGLFKTDCKFECHKSYQHDKQIICEGCLPEIPYIKSKDNVADLLIKYKVEKQEFMSFFLQRVYKKLKNEGGVACVR